jgi:ABC-2 type transport system ATP-binding protein
MIKILTGYLQPDDGQVTVDGLDVLARTREVQERIGYLPENAPLYPEMSVQSYLGMIAELRQIPAVDRLTYLSDAIQATGLQEHLARPIGELSKGFRQRVGLAQAIMHKPKLLILDEPTVGLDPTQIAQVRRLIRQLARHSTVLLSTHILSEVEATCDRVIILMNGEVKADASLAELSSTTDFVLVLGPGADPTSVHAGLKALPGVQSAEGTHAPQGRGTAASDERTYRIRGAQGKDLRPALYELARDRGWPMRELRRDVRTLEAIFNELATAELQAATADLARGEGERGHRDDA